MVNKDNFIKNLKNRNPRALDYVIEEYSNLVFKVSYSVLKNRSLTEECMNDVFLKVWDNVIYFKKDNREFVKWIMIMSKYTAIDMLRKELRNSNTVDVSSVEISDSKSFEDNIGKRESLEVVTKEIENMKPLDKEIFLRKFYLDQDNKEISMSLGISEKLINLRVFRGRKKLRERLSK